MAPLHAYLLLVVGIVLGVSGTLAVSVWRKALAARERERYFAAKINRMPRRAS